MTRTNFLRNHWIWWTVKVVSLGVQLPATWHVFMAEFSTRSQVEAVIVTVTTALLIDVFFIAASYFIESDEMRTLDKVPFIVVNILLAIFILSIGIKNEQSLLSFAPRIGIVGIVIADIIYFISEVMENYFSWESVEQRLRTKQKKVRRTQDIRHWRDARRTLKPELLQLAIERERKTLGIGNTPVVEACPDDWQEIEPGIFLTSENHYAWLDKNKEFHNYSTTGKPYSLPGAKLAQSRNAKQNGEDNFVQ